MSSLATLLDRVRRPRYTGENRCWPCTTVNLLLAALGAGVLGVGVASIAPASAGGAVAAVAFALSAAAIALRGYLVPGTPTLTANYFPEWLLGVFGKREATEETTDTAQTEAEAAATGSGTFDVEEELLAAGALEPDGSDDLSLTDEFRERWRARIADLEREGDDGFLLDYLGRTEGEVEYTDKRPFFAAAVDGHEIGRWESRPAFRADIAAADLLADRVDGWTRLPQARRGQLAAGLRLFLETCPDCGGPLSFDTETVPSCCHQREVAAVTCDDCEVRVFETEVRGSFAE
jgi:hypothetical protein